MWPPVYPRLKPAVRQALYRCQLQRLYRIPAGAGAFRRGAGDLFRHHPPPGGKFELADHGTLFLDAIGDVSMTTQVKLLRAIETKEIERLGGNNKKVLDFRLIAATSRDLPTKVINGRIPRGFLLPDQHHCDPDPAFKGKEGGSGRNDPFSAEKSPGGKRGSASTGSRIRCGSSL